MNTIPARAAIVSAALATLLLSGCASTTAAAPAAVPAAQPAAYDVESAQERLVETVAAGWVDTQPPAAHWIESTALLICKRQGVDVPDFTENPENQQLVIEAALEHLCPA